MASTLFTFLEDDGIECDFQGAIFALIVGEKTWRLDVLPNDLKTAYF